jgi:protein subunit release factor A
MKTLVIEIRAGEGGEDSRLLVQDMLGIYATYLSSQGL